ncbi:hypothetical protein GALMADRAFT_230022 [Galerina marginata CBS 339.88]|uniref:Uncharacterized protein n=1 Tax=Galerina marginata (strain CBS 339.88) TaxID=685588 RepID=A0A067SSS0_GALM3|nr:hypothetical protein GALMADRAFT_230022 [Galerina marginata CBS 339.88]
MLYFLRLPAADFPQIPVHLLELQSRIIAYAFTSPKQIASRQSITLKYSNCHQWFEMMQMCEEYDMTQTGKFDLIRAGMNSSDSEDTDPIPRSMVDTTVEQFFMIFSAFIQSAASIEDEHVKGTIYGHVVLRDFLQTPAYLYQYVSSQSGPTLSPDIQTVIESSLTYIASTLEKALTGNEWQRTDFLFICTCLFLERLLTFYPFYSDPPKDDETIERKLHPLVIALTRYEKTVDEKTITELFGYLCISTGLPYHEAQLNRKTYIPLYAFPQWLRSAVIEEFQGSILLLEHNQADEKHTQDPVLVLDSIKREKMDDMDDFHITIAEPDDYDVGALIDIDDDSDSQKLSGGRFEQTYLPHLPFVPPVLDLASRNGSSENRSYNPHAEQVV